MLSTTNMKQFILFFILLSSTYFSFSQNATFISPYRDSTVFIYSILDSNSTELGETEYRLHKIKKSSKGTITQVTRDTLNTIIDSSTFRINKDSTGFTVSSDFYLTPKQRMGIVALDREKNKKTLQFPAKFTLDTLNDIHLEYNFQFENIDLGTSKIDIIERYIEKGEFVQTALGRKYCYKVSAIKHEDLLFKQRSTKIIDWYSNEGLVKREFYVNSVFEKEYLLKKIK